MRKITSMTVVLLVAVGLMLPINMALAAAARAVQLGQPAKELSAEWWQWTLSIPSDVNPVLDDSGTDCVVGQRGDVWFLAGIFGGPAVTRNCSVPEDKVFFFPIVNQAFFNSPNACGQGPESYTVKEMRAVIAGIIDGARELSVTLDDQPVRFKRVQSEVFNVALPTDNVYAFLGIPCAEGIYSPAVDDGYYAQIDPLKVGDHTLHIHAELPTAAFVLDVTYNLTVVPVKVK